MSTELEFVGRISKFTGDRKIICIPNYMLEKISGTNMNKFYRIKLEEL